MQEQTLEARSPTDRLGLVVLVLGVAQNGVANMLRVDTDLMGPP